MRIPKFRHATTKVRLDVPPCASAPVLDEVPGAPYSEETFRYLLSVERKRIERSPRSLLLLLVGFKRQQDDDSIPPAAACLLLDAVKACIREVDFAGWYETGRVAGAVLPQRGRAPSPEVCRGIAERLMQTLTDHFPVAEARRLRVRVIEVRPKMRV